MDGSKPAFTCAEVRGIDIGAAGRPPGDRAETVAIRSLRKIGVATVVFLRQKLRNAVDLAVLNKSLECNGRGGSRKSRIFATLQVDIFERAHAKMRIIYDMGSNNGDDIPYYLLKSDLVVAIEANPSLIDGIKSRFQDEIASGRLIVENVVITTDSVGEVDFFIHKIDHVKSQFNQPKNIDQFEAIRLPSKTLGEIISTYGAPFYIKIDVEGYDQELLRDLFARKIFPPYISAESHSIDVFSQLVANGNYNSFKLVDGPSVHEVYGSHQVSGMNGLVNHCFPFHSAGPFGNDIIGPWERANTFFQTLARAGLGWKDIHASNVDAAER